MWRPVDTEFFAPRTPVAIVSIGEGASTAPRGFSRTWDALSSSTGWELPAIS